MDYFSSLNASALDPNVPTLFELLSAHQLQDLISPSLRYIITFYAQRHPQYLLKLANRFDEIYAVAMGAVEYYHLSKWNSSFTEKFYGLKRARVLTTPGLNARQNVPHLFDEQRRLTKKQVIVSLLFTIGLPYLKEKLDARYEMLKGRYAFRSIEADRPDKDDGPLKLLRWQLDRFILKIYPVINSAQSLICLAFYLGFLFQKTTATSPVDMIVGFQYSRLNQNDYRRNEPPTSESEEDVPLITKLSTPSGIKNIALSTLSYTLPTSMFLLKFLEWWYSSDFANQMSKPTRSNAADEEGNLPLPDAKGMPKYRSTESCPLCNNQITNPTVTETGVVFCYPCIYRYLEQQTEDKGGRCPVTGQRLIGCKYDSAKGEWEITGLRRLML